MTLKDRVCQPFLTSDCFAGTPSPDHVRAMLDAARWAPNADNAQIGRWIVVTSSDRVAEVLAGAGVPGATSAGEFTLIAACAAPALIKHRTREQPFALIDVPIAVVHAVAMAASMGYGWNFLPDIDRRGAALALSLPKDHMAVGLLLVGTPRSDAPAAPAPWRQLR